MVTLVISHQVQNFDEWKKGFEAGEEMRVQAGVHIKGIYQSVDDPNHVTVMSEAPSAEAAKTLMSNPDLRASMQKAGVISAPEIRLLNKIG